MTGPTTPAVSYYTEEVRRLLVEQFGETEVLTGGLSLKDETERWEAQAETFMADFRQIALYPD